MQTNKQSKMNTPVVEHNTQTHKQNQRDDHSPQTCDFLVASVDVADAVVCCEIDDDARDGTKLTAEPEVGNAEVFSEAVDADEAMAAAHAWWRTSMAAMVSWMANGCASSRAMPSWSACA
jgi:hypothetical protein